MRKCSGGIASLPSAAISAAIVLLSTNASAQWLDSLPSEARSAILWSADMEEGALDDWDYPEFRYAGGGIFNTGSAADAEVAADAGEAHSGNFAARSIIRNVYRAQNGNRAVRLMRWTNRPWDDGGEYFPTDAYFSTWMYFPTTYNPNKYAPWDPGDGGWWNVFQFKSDDSADVSQPLWTLNVEHDDDARAMSFYLYSKYNTPRSYGQRNPTPIPVGQWVHVEARYRQSSGTNGEIRIWQDGELILQASGVRTILSGPAVWGIGNYTDHIAGGVVAGTAELWFDDAAVSTRRLSSFVATTSPPDPEPALPSGAVGGEEPMFGQP